MIASVMTTRRAGRPIDFHIPTRLKSMAGYVLRNRFPKSCFSFWGGGKRRQNLHRRTPAVNATRPSAPLHVLHPAPRPRPPPPPCPPLDRPERIAGCSP